MKQQYTDDFLLGKLKQLLEEKGALSEKIIQNQDNFPSPHAFKEHFGTLYNAFSLVGFQGKKGKFDIKDAQKKLDERNGHFTILEYHGMRSNKSKVQCKDQHHIFNTSIDSLLRNKTDKHYGCPFCNKRRSTYMSLDAEITENETIEDLKKYPQIDGYGYIYRFTNLLNKKIYIGKTICPLERYRSHLATAFDEDSQCYNYPLYKAIRKYGLNNFSFAVILELVPNDKIYMVEREYMYKYNSLANIGWGYNQTDEIFEANSLNSCINKNSKKVALLNDEDEIIEIFSSVHECAKELFGDKKKFSNVARTCRGESKKGRYLNKKLAYLDNIKEKERGGA